MSQIVEQKLGQGVSVTNSGDGFEVTPNTLSDVVEFAKFMCQSQAGIPNFLRGNAPDCAAVIMQSLKWGFDPFSVAQKSYKVKDIIAYEAQLIAAVVNTRSGIKGRLKYSYEGEGKSLQCTVTGVLDGEEFSYTSPRIDQITTQNSPLWKSDPQQQLGYFSARSWARRYVPEVILGAYDREEAQSFQGADNAKDVTPATPSIVGRLKAAQEATEQPQGAREGFSEGFAHAETKTLSGDAETADPETGEITDTPDGEAAGSSSIDPASSDPASSDAPSPSQAGASSAGGDSSSSQSSPATNEVDKPFLIELLQALYAAKGPDPDVVNAQSDLFADRFNAANVKTQSKANTILTQIKMLGAEEIERGECIEYLAGIIGVEPADLGLSADE